MFRVDSFDVIDATESGDAARFINHSCEVRRAISYFFGNHTYSYLDDYICDKVSYDKFYSVIYMGQHREFNKVICALA